MEGRGHRTVNFNVNPNFITMLTLSKLWVFVYYYWEFKLLDCSLSYPLESMILQDNIFMKQKQLDTKELKKKYINLIVL